MSINRGYMRKRHTEACPGSKAAAEPDAHGSVTCEKCGRTFSIAAHARTVPTHTRLKKIGGGHVYPEGY